MKSNHSAVLKTNIYKFFFVHGIKIQDLSPNESKLIEGVRAIKVYESMSENEILSALIASKSVKKSKNKFDDTKAKKHFSKSRIEKIRKKTNESMYKFSKSKINEIGEILMK